jgi:hypothetical protein
MVIRGLSKYEIFQLNAIAAKKFFWVIGHGQTLPLNKQPNPPDRVPPKTWVIFISKPGRYLNFIDFIGSEFFTEECLKKTSLVRNLILGLVPEDKITPLGLRLIHPKYWAKRLYCPGDPMPATGVNMKDEEIDDLNKICGVNDTSNPVNQNNNNSFPKLHEKRYKVSKILQENGPGIYFIVACRQLSTQNKNALKAAFNRYAACGFQNSANKPVNNTGLISHIERNNKARRECQLIRPWLFKIPVSKAWKKFKQTHLNAPLTKMKILRKRKLILSRLQR